MDKNLLKGLPSPDGKCHRNRKGQLAASEIMTIIICYHFGSFANFKHYYLFYIRQHLSGYFPEAVSYNRFAELMPRVFFHMMLFMKLRGFGKCSGISFVDSTMIPVCHNLRRIITFSWSVSVAETDGRFMISARLPCDFHFLQ